MQLDFPNPPLTVGQQFTATNSVNYQWDGTVWTLTPRPGASGPAGGDLTGFYPDPQIRPGAIIDSDITSVAWTKLIAPFIASLPVNPRGMIAASGNYVDWYGNVSGTPGYLNTKPSWLLRIDYTADAFQVWRMPVGGAWAILFSVALSGITMTVPIALPANSVGAAQIVDGSVGANEIGTGAVGTDELAIGAVNRDRLVVNSIYGGIGYQSTPPFFLWSGPGWTNYVTLGAFTGRGGMVHLFASAGLSAALPAGGQVGTRWVRNGGVVVTDLHLISTPPGTYDAVPNLNFLDIFAGTGSLQYTYQVYIDGGGTLLGPDVAAGGVQGAVIAVEMG